MSLTNEDKAWIVGSLHSLESRMMERVENLEVRMVNRIEGVETKLLSLENRMTERIEGVETKLLTEFHKWASPNEARQRTHTATLKAIDLETEALTDRVSSWKARSHPPDAGPVPRSQRGTPDARSQ